MELPRWIEKQYPHFDVLKPRIMDYAMRGFSVQQTMRALGLTSDNGLRKWLRQQDEELRELFARNGKARTGSNAFKFRGVQ